MKSFKKWMAIGLTAVMVTAMSSAAVMADGGDIYVMFQSNVMSLDTNLATDGDSFEIIADCIDGLTQMDADGAAIPAIAESWDVSDDGCTGDLSLFSDPHSLADPEALHSPLPQEGNLHVPVFLRACRSAEFRTDEGNRMFRRNQTAPGGEERRLCRRAVRMEQPHGSGAAKGLQFPHIPARQAGTVQDKGGAVSQNLFRRICEMHLHLHRQGIRQPEHRRRGTDKRDLRSAAALQESQDMHKNRYVAVGQKHLGRGSERKNINLFVTKNHCMHRINRLSG